MSTFFNIIWAVYQVFAFIALVTVIIVLVLARNGHEITIGYDKDE